MARRKPDGYTRWLQQQLNAVGFSLAEDGINGKQTQKAIREVQMALGLRVTGTATREFSDAFKSLRMAGPAQLTGSVASPSGPGPSISGRLPMTPPIPNLRPPQGGPQPSAMAMPPDQLIGPTGRSGLDIPPSAPGPDREMIARMMGMPLGGESSPTAMQAPPMQSAGPGAGSPMGMPSGGMPMGMPPMTGPGGSPGQMPQSNIWSDILDQTGLGKVMIPDYEQRRGQSMPDVTTGNSPLAGVDQYQPGMEQPQMPPTQQEPPGISQGDFAGRFDPQQMQPPMQAGAVPPEVLRQLIQRLLQMGQ